MANLLCCVLKRVMCLVSPTIRPSTIDPSIRVRLHQAEQQVAYLGNPGGADPRYKAANRELRPLIMPMRTDEMVFDGNLEVTFPAWSMVD